MAEQFRLATDADFRVHLAYEWVVETVVRYSDGEEDVVDVTQADTYAEALQYKRAIESDGSQVIIGLTRIQWTEAEGMRTRVYAYLGEDGVLPERFHEGDGPLVQIPARFRREVANAK